MHLLDPQEARNGVFTYRPRGEYSLVEAVDLVSATIADCRRRGVDKLLIDARGVKGVPIPTLIDRFLMAEDWAQAAQGRLVMVLVVSPEYIHPRKFAVKVALHLGLTSEVYSSEDEALQWLLERAPPPLGDSQ